jgi:hypothetical protein
MGLNEKSMKIFGGFGRISYICNGNELLDKGGIPINTSLNGGNLI